MTLNRKSFRLASNAMLLVAIAFALLASWLAANGVVGGMQSYPSGLETLANIVKLLL